MVEVSLTVGKLDASLALLLTKDHHLIEFPTILLPDGVQAGSIVKIRCDRDLDNEKKEEQQFHEVQDQIFKMFGQSEPEKPVLKLRNVTQTSCVLEWEPLKLSTASIKSLTLYKNGERLGQIPNPLINTTTKLSGLPIDTPFKFSLRLDTTAGVYHSNEIEVRTHKMTDLSGITVCLGEIDWKEEGINKEDIADILKSMNAKPLQSEVKVDTTHFVCTLAKGQQWKKAVDNNIPVVRPEWLKACDTDKRIVGVRMFYLDANGELIKQYKITHKEKIIVTNPPAASDSDAADELPKNPSSKNSKSEQFDDVPLDGSSTNVTGEKTVVSDDAALKETADKLTKAEEIIAAEKTEVLESKLEEDQKAVEKTEIACTPDEVVDEESVKDDPTDKEPVSAEPVIKVEDSGDEPVSESNEEEIVTEDNKQEEQKEEKTEEVEEKTEEVEEKTEEVEEKTEEVEEKTEEVKEKTEEVEEKTEEVKEKTEEVEEKAEEVEKKTEEVEKRKPAATKSENKKSKKKKKQSKK
ncbi:hypothetical protein DASC09_063660 [Saccharomycopsis crataegensis]|uniref:Chitin biosynthesis protein CHS5 n=1 Tax=Saccharomycopsis crataegensis TaxID=43959 RepID=A0AAV5QVV6_9ASCO|nr:hypothetical protein DASC09_063660 [Saccharomycopsis crataegensis]